MDGDITTLPNGLDAVEIGGVPRMLSKLPPITRLRAAFPPFFTAAPQVDPADWVELNRRQQFDDSWILDQKNHGSCVGFSCAGGLMRVRTMGGLPFVRLSGSYTYAWINRNRDEGAMISDGLESLIKYGACPELLVPWNKIYRRDMPATADNEALRNRVLEAYHADNFAELMSGIQLGFIGVGAVQVGSRFTTLNAQGVAGFDNGPGNHAVVFDGAHKLPNGEWVLDMPNSWGLMFGQQGRAYITRRHIDSVQQDCFLIRAATQDPQNPLPPIGG